MADDRRKRRGIRGALTFLVALVFILLGLTKIVQLPFEVHALGYYGLPVWFVVLLGFYEVLGGLGVIFRPTAFFAAAGLSLEMVGAVVTFWLGGTPSLLVLAFVSFALTGFLTIASWPEVGRALRHAAA